MAIQTVLLAFLLLGPPSEGPAPAETGPGHRDHARGPALTFDQSLGAAIDAPMPRGLAEAASDKRRNDSGIAKVVVGPEVQIMPGARVVPEAVRGFEIQITATQSWSLSNYSAARREAAEAETDLLDARARASALDQRLAAAHAWIRLHGAEIELGLAREELALAESSTANAQLGAEEGVYTRADVADARAREAQARALVIELVGLVHDLGLELGRQTGSDGQAPASTLGDHPDPQLPSETEIRRAFDGLAALPKVAVERLRARAERASAAEARGARASTMNAGFSFQRESGSDIVVFGVIGAQFGVYRGVRERGTALAAAREAEAAAEVAVIDLGATLTIALHDLHHTEERMAVLRDRTLPAHQELVDARTLALEGGEGTLAALLEAKARRSAVARELAAAEADWVWARVEVWLYLEAFEAAEEASR